MREGALGVIGVIFISDGAVFRAAEGNAANPVIRSNIQYGGGARGRQNTEKENKREGTTGRNESTKAFHNEAIIKQTPSPVK